jgi:L-ascorbate metabolism protein UlaG (beta-lactamase superfamily)
MQTVPTSNHFDGRRFFNPSGPALQPMSAVPRMLLEGRTPWPSRIDEPTRLPAALEDFAAVITYIGHATLLIQTPAGNILTDPMYSQRAGPFNLLGPRRVRQPAVRFDDLPPISLVLLSHNHYDHCDLRTLRRLAERSDPIVATPIGNRRLVESAGIRRVEEFDWWQSAHVAGASVSVTPAHHFSARGPFDRNHALWGGFMLALDGVRIFFAGDTAYGSFFQEIGQRLGPIDLALLPIGAYEPRWFMRSVHMDPHEAVQAHVDLGASRSVGIHFGTFQLTTEGVDAPLQALEQARDERHVAASEFSTLAFGDSLGIRSRNVDESS